jgi:hypothetical protein
MASKGNRTFGQKVNTWVQTVGIVIAAIWGGYTYIYKEITTPRFVPMQVVINAELEKMADSVRDLPYTANAPIPIRATISASNRSSQFRHNLFAFASLFGYRYAGIYEENEEFVSMILEYADTLGLWKIPRHRYYQTYDHIGYIYLRDVNYLAPGETMTKQLMLNVPRGAYDYVEMYVTMVTAIKRDVVGMTNVATGDRNVFRSKYYQLRADGTREFVPEDSWSDWYVRVGKPIQLQIASASAMLYLGD